MKIDNSKSQGVIGAMGAKDYKAGDLKGTTSKPVMRCSFGSCIIDYGDFILQGVPDNFAEFVESSGSSGGTEKLLSLMEQIAEQLEKAGDDAGAAEIREMANIGHTIALMDYTVEGYANDCKSSPKSYCFSNKYQKDINHIQLDEIRSKFSELLIDPIVPTYSMYTNLRFARPDYFQQYSKSDLEVKSKKYIGAAFLKKYNDVISNDKYSEPMRGVIQSLYVDVSNLTNNIHGLADHQLGVNIQVSYDPITAKTVFTPIPFDKDLSNITNPKTGVRSDLNSVLICQAGWNKSTGSKCY